jgi:hypothetical protein
MKPDRDLRRHELNEQLKAERMSLQHAHWLEKMSLACEAPIAQSDALKRHSKEVMDLANKYMLLFKELDS